MSARAARVLFWGYVIIATLALTFPAVTPFNRALPLILGMPFILVWVAFWVVLAFVVFLVVNRTLEGAGREGGA